MKKILFSFCVLFIISSNLFSQEWNLGSKYPFKFKFDNVEFSLKDISGLDVSSQPAKSTQGNSKVFSTVKMPGLTKVANATLKKGVVANNKKWIDLLEQINKTALKKKDATIELYDENGQLLRTWLLKNAYILKIAGKSLDSNGKSVTIETMDIAYEGLTAK